MLPLRADDVELVVVARGGAGHEQLPVADAAHAHRMAARIPEIEIADHADPPRIGREHHEGDAVDAVERHRMRAELVVEPLVGAFAEQIEVEIAQDRRKTVGVFEVDHGVAEAGAQLVALRAVRQRACEQAGVVNARKLRGFAVLADRLDVRGFGQERAYHGLAALGMEAEIVKGIGVAAFDDRIGFRGQFGHEASARVRGQDSHRTGQRDAQPVWPVGQFVFDLVERLFEQEEIEHPFGGCRIGRPQTRIGHDLAIGGKKRRGGAVAPSEERRAEPAMLVGGHLQRALERRGGRIVDRADQAGDVARRGRLAPPLLQRPVRFAREIDDEDIVLDDQHLAEMEVAVMTDLEAVDIGRQQRVQAVRQGVALRQQPVDERAIGFPDRIAPLLQRVEGAFGAGHRLFDPAPHVRSIRRFRRKIGEFIACGEREVQLGDASPGLRHVAQIGELFLAFARMFAGPQHALLVDEAIEIG